MTETTSDNKVRVQNQFTEWGRQVKLPSLQTSSQLKVRKSCLLYDLVGL